MPTAASPELLLKFVLSFRSPIAATQQNVSPGTCNINNHPGESFPPNSLHLRSAASFWHISTVTWTDIIGSSRTRHRKVISRWWRHGLERGITAQEAALASPVGVRYYPNLWRYRTRKSRDPWKAARCAAIIGYTIIECACALTRVTAICRSNTSPPLPLASPEEELARWGWCTSPHSQASVCCIAKM